MKNKPLSVSVSRQRLDEFRTKLESNFTSKTIKRDDQSIHKASNHKISPFSRFKIFTDEIQRSITPKKLEYPELNHYRNLSYFKAQASSPKSQPKNVKVIPKAPAIGKSIDFLSLRENKRKSLSDIIPIETLSAATKMIACGGIKTIPKVYILQLKEFCDEVLSKIN